MFMDFSQKVTARLLEIVGIAFMDKHIIAMLRYALHHHRSRLEFFTALELSSQRAQSF